MSSEPSNTTNTDGQVKITEASGLARKHRKIAIPVFCLLFILGTIAIGMHLQKTQTRLIQTTALQNADQYAKILATFLSIYTSEVVIPAKKAGVTITHNYQHVEGSIPLPATLSMKLGNEMNSQGGVSTKLYSPYPFPWRKQSGGLTDEFAEDAWSRFQDEADTPFYRFETIDGTSVLRFAIADSLRENCVSCHNSHPDTPKNDWKAGQVRGILEVHYPMTDTIAQAKQAIQGTFILWGGADGLGPGRVHLRSHQVPPACS
jgi:hypothetical protein